jgi:hypothetical protein
VRARPGPGAHGHASTPWHALERTSGLAHALARTKSCARTPSRADLVSLRLGVGQPHAEEELPAQIEAASQSLDRENKELRASVWDILLEE